MQHPGYALDAIQSLMIWIRQKPTSYCATVGELDTLLHFFHLLWSKTTGRELEYSMYVDVVRELMGVEGVRSIITEDERIEFLSTQGRGLEMVLSYWTQIDEHFQLTPILDKL